MNTGSALSLPLLHKSALNSLNINTGGLIMSTANQLLENLQKKYFDEEFKALHWTGSFEEYLAILKNDPNVLRSSFQRLYDMVLSYGTEEYEDSRKKMTHYKFFEDPVDDGKDAIFGLDIYLMKLMNMIKSAANQYGIEKRILLLHGPVGSSKSTITRLLKKGLENFSRIPEGALYSFDWVKVPKFFDDLEKQETETVPCPMHEDPIHLIPLNFRIDFVNELIGKNKTHIL